MEQSNSPVLRSALIALREMRAQLDAFERGQHGPIAIVGAACRLPGGVCSPDELWARLCAGFDAVTEVPEERWAADAMYDPDPAAPGKVSTRHGAFLQGVGRFDRQAFGLTEREAAQMDPQQRIFLEVAFEALAHAGCRRDRLAGSATSIFVGVHGYSNDHARWLLEHPEALDGYSMVGSAHDVIAGRLAYLLDLRGPSMAIDTACSSSLLALHLAVNSLRNHESDLALVGGVNLSLRPEVTVGFSKMGMMSPTGRCRAFDARGDGFVRGEGCVVLVLKRASDAEQSGDSTLALIRGTAANQDGRTNGFTAPSGRAQTEVIRRALSVARLSPDRLGYVEAHGTGTPVGDPIEAEALAAVLGQRAAHATPCRIGSVKGNFGHLEGAAGVLGVLKTALCLERQAIPVQPHYEALNPLIKLSALEVPRRTLPWPAEQQPQCAGVSSFGWSGTNVHAILERAPTPAVACAAASTERPLILPVSGRDAAELRDAALGLRSVLESTPAERMEDLCWSAGARRDHAEHRIAFTGRDGAALSRALSEFAQPAPGTDARATEASRTRRGIAFVFSGHGGQWPDMGRGRVSREPEFQVAFAAADAAIAKVSGRSLLQWSADAGADPWRALDFAQPALFAWQVATAALLRSWGLQPDAVVGHSLGEVAAAYVAGALTLDECASVIVHRSRLLAQLEGRGAMALIGVTPEAMQRMLPVGSSIDIAAHNGPSAIVIAGPAEEVAAVVEQAARRDIFCRRVAIGVAAHSRQVDALMQPLERALAGLRPSQPAIRFASTAQRGGAPALDARYWADNLRNPVQFWEAIRGLANDGHQVFIEISPHPVLAPSMRETLAHGSHDASIVCCGARGRCETETLTEALAALYAAGLELDWDRLYPGPRHLLRLPARAWRHQDYPVDVLRGPIEPATARELSSSWVHVTEAGAARSRLGSLDLEPKSYRQKWSVTDRLANIVLADVLGRLGVTRVLDESRRSASELVQLLQIEPRFEPLVERWLDRLASVGRAQRGDGARFLWLKRPSESDIERAWAEVEATFTGRAAFFVDYFKRCAELLPNVLTGSAPALETLFPDGEYTTATALYRDWPAAEYANGILRESILAALPFGRAEQRVLELGAGTGGTASTLVPALAPRGVAYVFSDVSELFLNRARGMFAEYPGVEYRRLDIDQDPIAQGFEPGSFDVIVASNVLHTARDVRQSLQWAHTLLKPGGLLACYELTEPLPWLEFTVSVIEGWRHFDDGIREGQPLLSAARWTELFERTGFTSSATFPEPGSEAEAIGQHVLLARSSDAAPAASRKPGRLRAAKPSPFHVVRWAESPSPTDAERRGVAIIVADSTGVGARLAQCLKQQGDRRRVVELVSNASAHAGGAGGPPDLADAEGWRRLLSGVAGVPEPVEIVYLKALDVPGAAAAWRDPEQLDARCKALGRQLVGTLGAFVRACSGLGCTPTLRLVTRGAIEAGDDDACPNPVQGLLWGAGRVFAQEHPELFGGLVDLDAHATNELAADALVAELRAPTKEQSAWRRGRRMVARLGASPAPNSHARPVVRPDATYVITGGLGRLGLRVAEWLASLGAKHLVLISRRGLDGREQEPAPRDGVTARRAALVRKLVDAGVRVEIETIDVGDAKQFSPFVAGLRRRAKIAGVVHAAAHLDSATLLTLDAASLHRVIRPKVVGGIVLDQELEEVDLDFFVSFSSAVSLLGPPGFADYAAANAFLDSLMASRRARGRAGVSIAWGVWSEFGEDSRPTAERLIRSLQGGAALSVEEGLQALGHFAGAPRGSTPCCPIVAPIDWRSWSKSCPWLAAVPVFCDIIDSGAHAPASRDAKSPSAFVDQLRALPFGRPRRELMHAALREELTRTTRQPVAASQSRVPFTELGLDSLMSLELRRRLEQRFGLRLPTSVTWNYSDLQRLGSYLAGCLGVDLEAPTSHPSSGPGDEPAPGAAADPLVADGS